MKRFKKIILLFLLVIFCSSCGSGKLKSISYNKLIDKLKDKDTFFFVVIRDGCEHCEKFVPKIEDVLSEYNLSGYKLNYSDLDEEEDKKFYSKFGVDGTPTTIFIKEGREVSMLQRIEGNVSKEKIIDKLIINGYINEKQDD